MSDFTFWSDVSTVISYTYFSYSASHALLQQSLPPFLYILSIFGTRWPALTREWTAVRVRQCGMDQASHPNDGVMVKRKEHCEALLFYQLRSKCPWCSLFFIHSNTTCGFFIPPLDGVHSPGMGSHHSLKTCLCIIDYSASLIKLIYSEGLQTCNNVECLDR